MAFRKKPLVFLLILILILGGCFSKKKRRAPKGGPEKLYAKALSRFNRAKYQSAMDFFENVKNYFPESPEALRAEIKIADCHFSLLEYEEAIAIYEEFRKLHPYHEDIPYILFQIGQVYFKQIGSADRDQIPARKALSNFQYLVETYPPSVFTEKAAEKIPICRRSLAEHEFLVGRFYYKRGNYRGAAGRFEWILLTYPDTEVVPKALFYLGKTFMNLSRNDKAKATFMEITHQYPDSEYATKAEGILTAEWNETGTTTGLEPSPKSTAAPM